MCVSNVFYPVAIKETGKKQVLFKYGYPVNNRDDYDNFILNKNAWLDMTTKSLRFPWISRFWDDNIKTGEFIGIDKFIQVPCGSCSECLKANSKSWALRILKEAERFENNYFITFTYDNEHLPLGDVIDPDTGEVHKKGLLVKDEISKFNKKLKTYLDRKGLNSDFRFYAVGEYGGQTARPHYHVIYFNLEIPDIKFHKVAENGSLYFTSDFISEVWNKGIVEIGTVDLASACYVARYCDKKRQLTKAERRELEQCGIVPEFSNMSRRPGIGADYLEKVINNIENDVFNISYKTSNFSIPLYYSKKLKKIISDEVLKKYEDRTNDMIANRLFSDFYNLSNIDDIHKYKLELDQEKKKSGKKRNL